MSDESGSEYETADEEWRSIPGCIGTFYDPNPRLKDWIIVYAPDHPRLDAMKHRLFVDTLPKKKRRIDQEPNARLGNDSGPPTSTTIQQASSSSKITQQASSFSAITNQQASGFSSAIKTLPRMATHSTMPTPARVKPPTELNQATTIDKGKQKMSTAGVRSHMQVSQAPTSSQEPQQKLPVIHSDGGRNPATTAHRESIPKAMQVSNMSQASEQPRRKLPVIHSDGGRNLATTAHRESIPKATQASNISSNMSQASEQPRRKLPVILSDGGGGRNRVSPFATATSKANISKVVHEAKMQYDELSQEQKLIHDCVVRDKQNVFFSGSAGTGKSVLLRSIIKSLKTQYEEDEVAVTAPTGIASVNIGGGTIHRFAHINLGDKPADEYIKKIRNNQSAVREFTRTKILIIDEISMIDGVLLDKIERICSIVRSNRNVPFGGIRIVLCGDFHQLPPVNYTRQAFEATCWNRSVSKTFILKTVFRQTQPLLVNLLNKIRIGIVDADAERLIKSLDRELIIIDPQIRPTELYPTRSEVDYANNTRLHGLSSEEHVFLSEDSGYSHFYDHCMAPKELKLKIGAQVMLIKNLTPTLVNGSLGVVEEVQVSTTGLKIPVIKFSNGESRRMHRENWTLEVNGTVKSKRTQIPLILAWALSIHKSQGQTIDYVRVDLNKAFERGQAYVALSRARSLETLQVVNFKKSAVICNSQVTEFYNCIERAAK